MCGGQTTTKVFRVFPEDIRWKAGWHYATDLEARNIEQALKDETNPGDIIGLYTGNGDWDRYGVEGHFERILPLVDAIKEYGSIPALVGCACHREEKKKVADALGIPFIELRTW